MRSTLLYFLLLPMVQHAVSCPPSRTLRWAMPTLVQHDIPILAFASAFTVSIFTFFLATTGSPPIPKTNNQPVPKFVAGLAYVHATSLFLSNTQASGIG
ncbi:hypothetical protein VKT23_014936 [Stygiomarasmius scandens]|uniref:Uncharacterized protein n=1 Tax=Marasmiellus scandens TaxID=2682957 RepID=A0ABR1IYS4_9AGAR